MIDRVDEVLGTAAKKEPADAVKKLYKEIYNIQLKMARHKDDGIGRNQPCPCGSGLKYKRCCLKSMRVEIQGLKERIAVLTYGLEQ